MSERRRKKHKAKMEIHERRMIYECSIRHKKEEKMFYIEHENSQFILEELKKAGYKQLSKALDRKMDSVRYVVSYLIIYEDAEYHAEFTTKFTRI